MIKKKEKKIMHKKIKQGHEEILGASKWQSRSQETRSQNGNGYYTLQQPWKLEDNGQYFSGENIFNLEIHALRNHQPSVRID